MGHDKAFLEIAGAPLWQRQFRLLESLSPHQIFLAGPARDEWRRAGCKVIADAQPESGPLGGLVAGLRICSTPFLLALAVDLPRMTAGCLRRLLELCHSGRGAVPFTDRLEPLAAIYPRAALALAEELLVRGDYSLQQLVNRCLADGLMLGQAVQPDEHASFLNLNTPADVMAMR